MKIYRKEIKPYKVEMFAGYFLRRLPLEDKWYPEEEKKNILKKYERAVKHSGNELYFDERIVEVTDMVAISLEEYESWKSYKEKHYDDLHG